MAHTYIIAELSANHGHRIEHALESIRAAKECGADAIKIQTYTAETMTLDCDQPDFVVAGGTLWDGQRLHSLYEQAYTPWEWHEVIFNEARRVGIECFSTPFDTTAVDFLESLSNPIYKIASFEITDIHLIDYIARLGKPIIMSTGIATIEDIELALLTCHKAGNNDITLLKCTSAYPARIEDANLAIIPDMRDRFNVKVGLSDHSVGYEVAMTAVALGAEVIEKHFIIDRSIGGPDAAFSMNKEEFAAMVKAIRTTEAAIGEVSYPVDPAQIKGRQFSRSLYVAQAMKPGDVITCENVRSVRPGYGLHPKYLSEILGKKVNQELKKGTRFSLKFIS